MMKFKNIFNNKEVNEVNIDEVKAIIDNAVIIDNLQREARYLRIEKCLLEYQISCKDIEIKILEHQLNFMKIKEDMGGVN